MLCLIGFDSRLVTTARHFQAQNQMNISELPYPHSPETRFRGLVTTLKCRLQGGSNLFALGPPSQKNRRQAVFFGVGQWLVLVQDFFYSTLKAG